MQESAAAENSDIRISRKKIHRFEKETSPNFWKSILLAIPKNLVYIFVGIVCFAFAAMCYITYTEKDLNQFLRYDRTQEVIIVDQLFTSLKASLKNELTKQRVAVISKANFNNKQFFDQYLSESRPVAIKYYAEDWKATERWSDFDYLSKQAGNTVVRLSAFTRHPWNDIVLKNKKKGDDEQTEEEKQEQRQEAIRDKYGSADGKFSAHS